MTLNAFRCGLLAATATIFAVPAVAQDWTGPYVGGHAGYSRLSDKNSERLNFDTNLDGNYNDTVNTSAGANAFSPGFCDGAPNGNSAASACRDDDGGADVGLRLGYDWQSGNFVYGVVGEIAKLDLTDNVTGFSTTPAAYTFTRKTGTVTALRGRAGYAMNDYLLYGTAGFAWADLDRSFTTTNTANSFTPRGGDNAKGYQIGFGTEKKVMENWTLGAEYLYTSLDDDDYTVRVGPGTAPATNPFLIANAQGTDMKRSEDKLKAHSLRFTVTYRFGM
ncbi:outer membrane beta-barrel protein [Asticcacaulis sp. BYS171W]|uniref:Outer membrane beta-barrel protein n=1 Tax=Asticcacaulis aquaticus TaxID=2984212 RepID=A0ABT5HWP3_9CAUL|nr:outer membrane beta-barrel protein [Asticcacaulis aquaticus]MDC7684353.1 outer membrane beta-barrel protein [Asticcacaulis aquaticus]